MSDSDLEIVAFVKHSRNELQSDALHRRKKTLQDYKARICDADFAPATYQQIFAECHLQLLQCLRDKSETCRELAVDLVSHFVAHLDRNDYYLTYIFPVLVDRLGTADLVEESEELRLELVRLLALIVRTYAHTECLVPFLSDIVRILCETAVDRYPKVKQATCTCIVELAAGLPRHFHLQCESLTKPVLQSFVHQHYRVRVVAVQAIGVIVLHSTSGGILQETVGPLADKLFDAVPTVRQTVAQVAARLLTEYRDRYSHFHRLLPLILSGLSLTLSGLCDEVPDTCTEAEGLWAAVGAQYERENEQELRDQRDFPIAAAEHYPAGVQRPGLGCRVLVQRHASKMLPALSTELACWRADVRVRCAQLLCSLVLHCEQFFAQCLPAVLPAMCTACVDEERAVRQNVESAGRIIGALVPVRAWAALVLPALRDAPTHGLLRVLRCMAGGAPPSELATIAGELADLLASEPIRAASRKPEYLLELVECCRTVLLQEPALGEPLFEALVSVVALSPAHDDPAAQAARALLQTVAQPAQAAGALLARLAEADVALWSAASTDRRVLDTLLLDWSPALEPHLALVSAVLVRALDARADPEAQLRTYQALSTFLDGAAGDALDAFAQRLVEDVLLVALVWRAGRTAEALRTAAAYCLSQALPRIHRPLPMDAAACQQLLALLTTLLEDASWRTRLYAIRALAELGRLLEPPRHAQWASGAAVALVQRLDDPSDVVRLAALQRLGTVSDTEPQHVRHVVDSVLVHMDDDDDRVRRAALDVLRAVGRRNKAYVMEKLARDKPLFRNGSVCDELAEYLGNVDT